MIVQKGERLWGLECDDCKEESHTFSSPTKPAVAIVENWEDRDEGHTCKRCAQIAQQKAAAEAAKVGS